MSLIDNGRKFFQNVGNTVRKDVERAEQAVGTAAKTVGNAVKSEAQKVHQFVDGFEQKAAKGVDTVKGLFGGNTSDLKFDGVMVGAHGQTFPPGTPLSQIPGVTPRNNPNPTETI